MLKILNLHRKQICFVLIMMVFVISSTTMQANVMASSPEEGVDKPHVSITRRLDNLRQIAGKTLSDLALLTKADVPLFGYKLVATDVSPIERDDTASLKLSLNPQGVGIIEVHTKFGTFIFTDISVDLELLYDRSGELVTSHYELEDLLKGFFMEVNIKQDLYWINVAFEGTACQFSYDGVIHRTFRSSVSFSNDLLASKQLTEVGSSPDLLAMQKLKISLKKRQEKGVRVFNERYFASNTHGGDYHIMAVSTTDYGISHEGWDFEVTYPEDLPDDYWEPYTCIDIGIHRFLPSESQVKSDLRYYNKKDVTETWIGTKNGYIRNIRAYSLGCHGGPYWDCVDQSSTGFTIWPDEIEDLWYYSWSRRRVIDIRPRETIAMIDACFSYSVGANGDPTMAHAFVDNGANAFVGSTISVPGASDTYMRAFWNDLCQNNRNVQQATTTLCNTYGSNWNVGDEWRIMGDSTATLP